jgi:hypothetical protein
MARIAAVYHQNGVGHDPGVVALRVVKERP